MKVTIRKHEIKKFLYLMDENLPMCEKGRRTGNLRKMRVWAHTPELDCNEKWNGNVSLLGMEWKWGKVTKERITITIVHPDGQEESLRLTIDDWMNIYKMICEVSDFSLKTQKTIKADGFLITFGNDTVEIKGKRNGNRTFWDDARLTDKMQWEKNR